MEMPTLTMRTPFKRLRYIAGSLFAMTSLSLAAGLVMGTALLFSGMVIAFILGVASLLLFGLEHVVIIEPKAKELTAFWSFFNFPVGRARRADLGRADRVKICARRMKNFRLERNIIAQTFTYPVYVMGKGAVLTHIIGWPEKKTESEFEFDTASLPNSAHFPSYAEWVAAHAARALGVGLEDGRDGVIYGPDSIPREWFDPSNIRMTLTFGRI